jgi:hypothetical protein
MILDSETKLKRIRALLKNPINGGKPAKDMNARAKLNDQNRFFLTKFERSVKKIEFK